MPAAHRLTATCSCGQVVFDLSGRQPGAVLVCPWCQRRSFLQENGKLADISSPGPFDRTPIEKRSLEEAARGVPAQTVPVPSTPAAPVCGTDEHTARRSADSELGSGEWKALLLPTGVPSPDMLTNAHVALSKAAAVPANKGAKCERTDGSPKPLAEAPRCCPVQRSKRPGDMPGSFLAMVVFLVGGNISAFVLLSLLVPSQADGSRLTWWGEVIPKDTIWPLIAVVVVGHAIGFLGWCIFLFIALHVRKAAPSP